MTDSAAPTAIALDPAGRIAQNIHCLARLALRIPAPGLARFTRPAVVTLGVLAGVSAVLSLAVMHASSRNASLTGTGLTVLMAADALLPLAAALLQLALVILYQARFRQVAHLAQPSAHQ